MKKKHYEVMEIILDESGYSAMLKNKKDLENENRLENIKELLNAMREFDNLESFLEHVALATAIDRDWEGKKINLMTMHASKGLEFDVVFLPFLVSLVWSKVDDCTSELRSKSAPASKSSLE